MLLRPGGSPIHSKAMAEHEENIVDWVINFSSGKLPHTKKHLWYISCSMAKPDYAIYAKKDADQSAPPCSLISVFVIWCLDGILVRDVISKISRHWLASVTEQTSLSITWSQFS